MGSLASCTPPLYVVMALPKAFSWADEKHSLQTRLFALSNRRMARKHLMVIGELRVQNGNVG